jgi:hypothetical protein
MPGWPGINHLPAQRRFALDQGLKRLSAHPETTAWLDQKSVMGAWVLAQRRAIQSRESFLKHNVRNLDRAIRAAFGLALLSLYFLLEGNSRWFGVIGFVPLITPALGTGPMYQMIGLNTWTARR